MGRASSSLPQPFPISYFLRRDENKMLLKKKENAIKNRKLTTQNKKNKRQKLSDFLKLHVLYCGHASELFLKEYKAVRSTLVSFLRFYHLSKAHRL